MNAPDTPSTPPAVDRPVWFLGPDRVPVRAGGKVPAGCTHWATEGDAQWTPLTPSPRRSDPC